MLKHLGEHRKSEITVNNNTFDSMGGSLIVAILRINDKSEVMRWMIEGQLGRRNLTLIQRVAVTEKYRPFYEQKAKESYEKDVGRPTIEKSLPKSDTIKVHTTDELAKLANVGHTAYHQAKTILDSKNEEVKQKVLSGDMSINAGYNAINQGRAVVYIISALISPVIEYSCSISLSIGKNITEPNAEPCFTAIRHIAQHHSIKTCS